MKDVDLSYRQLLVRDGKEEKDRVTMLPEKLVAPMRGHLARVRLLHARDLREGYGEVQLPYALARKCLRAGREWVQELLGHSYGLTTMTYTHVLNRGGRGVLSPLDR